MAKNSYSEKRGLKRGAWTPEEDMKLSTYIKRYGHWNWRELPKYAGLSRCGKSCRLRWMNYLRPNIKRGNYSREEEEIIISLHETLGSRWSAIAAKLPGRTDNEIKNHWHTHLKKRLKQRSSVSEEAKLQSEELLNCKANMKKESEPNNFLPSAQTPLILESSSVSPMSMNNSCSDSDAVNMENQVTDGYLNSSETVAELNGNFWTEPFLVEDSYLQDNFASALVNAEIEIPFSQMSLGEALWPYELFYIGSGMDFCFNNLI